MKIGITCYPTYGGSGALATELGLELGRRGHEVHIISYHSPFRLREVPEHLSFHEVDLSGAYPLLEYFPYSLALAVKQHEVALREGLEILHVHYAVPHATAAFLAKQMVKADHDIKVVTTLHGTDITLVGQEKSFYTVTKFSIEHSDGVTAVSEYLKEETYRHFGCDACSIETIPNFVNLKEYYPAERQPSSFCPEGHKLVLHISNFRRLKRVPEVVQIFEKIRRQVPAVLVLVGDGPQRPDAEAEVERLGLSGSVRFLGKLDTVADLLRAADLFLLPSTSESFGLVALESMACGVPVVASRVGGLPEVITDGENGALVHPDDLDGMAARGVEILRDGELWSRLRNAAVEQAQRFSEELIVPRYEDFYARVMNR